ncbi:Serine/arginine-rich splicing factor 3 [Theileria parva strain Muguga]|uniref:Splicing factor, putative n=1 Tax=Theileria parva TaxID=5875 RepID=Q4N0C3_THEPA|nr:Serine/arginine-rich splicing factor 3 [Theileria parva strain Muguga]EAN30961.1 Serine/arginine-rich splicing factor 3 [Theileria parva strain Muguga]|eukprot:XP_763244.1 splicing factor [Theileria parva strain Muguga]
MVGRRSDSDDHKLFVGNLVDSVTSQDLDLLFSKYGKVTNVWVARNPPGFGFVTFDDPRDAKDALIELNGKDLHGNSLRIERCRGDKSNRRRPYREPYSRDNKSRRSRSRSHSRGRRIRSRSPSYRRVRSRSS